VDNGRALIFSAALIGAGALAMAGCARGVYKPRDLPLELQPPVVADVHRLDLSRIAERTAGNDVIARGDVLDVSIASGYQDGELRSTPVRVGEDGWANVLLIGRVELAGLEVEQAEQAIAAAAVARGVFLNPQVTAVLAKRKSNRVTVMGAVKEPGVYELPRASSGLLEAIVAAGGLDEDAAQFIEIRRPGRQADSGIFSQGQSNQTAAPDPYQNVSHRNPEAATKQPVSARIDLVSAVHQGVGIGGVEDGDVVMVTRRDTTTIKVMGLVNKPGEFEMPRNGKLRVLDALSLAGGRPLEIATKVKVIRNLPGQAEPAVIELNVNDAKRDGTENLALAPGDVVSVEETPATMVVQMMQSFLRFGFSAAVPF
jgi:polysaccharide export outer membrane protein